MDYINIGARRLCGTGGQKYGLSLRQSLAFNFFIIFISLQPLTELLTYLVHDVFVVFPWIWNIGLRVWPFGEEGSH